MLDLDPREVIELPVDELGLRVLADLLQMGEWNEYNYTLRHQDARQSKLSGNPQALNALAEALGWLRSQSMIARTPGNMADAAIFVTRWGHEALKKTTAEVRATSRIQQHLHPAFERKVRRQFLLGEYENAIFVAMKTVEFRLRRLSAFGDEVIGTDLMTKAFKPSGPLADPNAPSGEVDGTMMLFRGAYQVLRNPSGHREVSFDDVTEASEAVMTASLLMRILDRVERRLTPNAM